MIAAKVHESVKAVDNILRCPRCGGRDVRRSQLRGTWDSLMQVFHRVPQRCRSCQNRFYTYFARGADDDTKPAGDRVTPAGQNDIR